MEVAKGFIRIFANTDATPESVKNVLAGANMLTIAFKGAVEGKTGDKLLGLDLPPEPGEVREKREPNKWADRLTLGSRAAPAAGAHIFLIQLLHLLNYGGGMVSNMPILHSSIRKVANWSVQFLWGPLLGFVEARGHQLVTKPVNDAHLGAEAGDVDSQMNTGELKTAGATA
jgi:hypothetical protein